MMFELHVAEQNPSVAKNFAAGQDKQPGDLLLQSWHTEFVVQSMTVPRKWFSSTLAITIFVCPVFVNITLSTVKLR